MKKNKVLSDFKCEKLLNLLKEQINVSNNRIDYLKQKIDYSMDDVGKKSLVKTYQQNISKEKYLVNTLYRLLKDAGLR